MWLQQILPAWLKHGLKRGSIEQLRQLWQCAAVAGAYWTTIKVLVGRVWNIPTNHSKKVQVKVYLSQTLQDTDPAETRWIHLGETQAWCPKQWKHCKKQTATPHSPPEQVQSGTGWH